jgi:hypothetical protein
MELIKKLFNYTEQIKTNMNKQQNNGPTFMQLTPNSIIEIIFDFCVMFKEKA